MLDSVELDVILLYGFVFDVWNIVFVGVFDVLVVVVFGELDGEVWLVDNLVVILWDVEKLFVVCGVWEDEMNF